MGPVRDLQRNMLSTNGQGGLSSDRLRGLGPESLRAVVLRDFQVACKAQKKSVEVRFDLVVLALFECIFA